MRERLLDPLGLGRTSFDQTQPARFRGVSGPEQGEPLEVVRGTDGAVEKLYWATYPLTRTPRSFGG